MDKLKQLVGQTDKIKAQASRDGILGAVYRSVLEATKPDKTEADPFAISMHEAAKNLAKEHNKSYLLSVLKHGSEYTGIELTAFDLADELISASPEEKKEAVLNQLYLLAET